MSSTPASSSAFDTLIAQIVNTGRCDTALNYAEIKSLCRGWRGELVAPSRPSIFRVRASCGSPSIIVKRIRNNVRAICNPTFLRRISQPGTAAVLGYAVDNPEDPDDGAVVLRDYTRGTLWDALSNTATACAMTWVQRHANAVALCSALQSLHAVGVLHHDISSANLLLQDDGVVVLSDFDLCQVSATSRPAGLHDASTVPTTVTGSTRIGTPGYMCPSFLQAQHGYGVRQEAYAFGVVMLELYTGRMVASQVDLAERCRFACDPAANVTGGTELVDLEGFKRLALECCSVRPDDRPQSFASIRRRLDALLRRPTPPALRIEAVVQDAAGRECIIHGDTDVRDGIACPHCSVFICAGCVPNMMSHHVASASLSQDPPCPNCAAALPSNMPLYARDQVEALVAAEVSRRVEAEMQAARAQEAQARLAATPLTAEDDAAMQRLKLHIENELLVERCPFCGVTAPLPGDWTGCMMIKCGMTQASPLQSTEEDSCFERVGWQYCGCCCQPESSPWCVGGLTHQDGGLTPIAANLREVWNRRLMLRQGKLDAFLRDNVHTQRLFDALVVAMQHSPALSDPTWPRWLRLQWSPPQPPPVPDPRTTTAGPTPCVFLIDASRSMICSAEDLPYSATRRNWGRVARIGRELGAIPGRQRWPSLVQAFKVVIASIASQNPATKIAVIAFGRKNQTRDLHVGDVSAINASLLDTLEPDMDTEYHSAFSKAHEVMRAHAEWFKDKPTRIILATDGEDEPSSKRPVATAIRDLCQEFIIAEYFGLAIDMDARAAGFVLLEEAFRESNVTASTRAVEVVTAAGGADALTAAWREATGTGE